MQSAAPAVPPRADESATRPAAADNRRSRVGPSEGDSVHLIYVQKWLAVRDRYMIGLVQLSNAELPLPVYNFTVAAQCQDAELKGYPVVADIRYGREHYLAGLKRNGTS